MIRMEKMTNVKVKMSKSYEMETRKLFNQSINQTFAFFTRIVHYFMQMKCTRCQNERVHDLWRGEGEFKKNKR